MTINKRVYNLMLNGSLFGLGISFIYYSFSIEAFPKGQQIIDYLYYLSLITLIISIIFKLLKRVKND